MFGLSLVVTVYAARVELDHRTVVHVRAGVLAAAALEDQRGLAPLPFLAAAGVAAHRTS